MKFQLSAFPLQKTSQSDLQRLSETLWRWNICLNCKAGHSSILHDVTCQWPTRSPKVNTYFGYYQRTVGSYVPDLLPGDEAALRSHDDLIEIIQMLKNQPDVARAQITKSYFSKRILNGSDIPSLPDQNRAFDLAVKVMMMVSCAIDHESLGLLESGVMPLIWRDDESISEFLAKVFPVSKQQFLNEESHFGRAPGVKALLTANRLQRIAGLKLKATDDLRDHLRVDEDTGTLLIYHCISFLIENIVASKASPQITTNGQAVQVGNIPRQLALEVVDSLQKILFPPDPDSQRLLRTLIAKSAFDPICLDIDPSSYRRDDEHEIGYQYLSERLTDLYEEVLNPKPRSLVEKWAERRSGARYVMLATLIGVVIAVFLGFLALVVSVFQAWVGYQAWKHPVQNS